MLRLHVMLTLLLVSTLSVMAQAPTATLDGRVLDPSKAVIEGVTVLAIDIDTNIKYSTKTNSAGLFRIVNLPPGNYRLEVSKAGFRTIVNPGVVLHLQDVVALNFDMAVGSTSESITVTGGAPLVNTESSAVSTVVDRTYVANMPLNGRSFQDLILLAPGVNTTSPQIGTNNANTGEFSVNGQRTESNYYTVDGVSANTGIVPIGPGNGDSGSLGASTAVGTTQALVSVDALEEFRVQTSTYSAEYGRNPGGQFSLVTRSGTNQWHGTAFDYVRNNIFDANNWFNDFFAQPEPALRQNDFGGTLGGPVEIPGLYHGKDKTFLFVSYESLRATQPQAAAVNYVPDLYLRTCTPAILQQVLNAFPQPTFPAPPPDCTQADPGSGLVQFIGTWSNPSLINAYSIRLDHRFNDKLKLFFRFSDTPSQQDNRGTGDGSTPSMGVSLNYASRTYTFGATSLLSTRLNNELRVNYSSNLSLQRNQINSFGGAQAVDLLQLQGVSQTSNSYQIGVNLSINGNSPALFQGHISGVQRQWNIVDTVGVSLGRHQLKFGFDYRRLAPVNQGYNPNLRYFFFSASAAQANSVDLAIASPLANAYPLFTNFSAFVADEWRIAPRLNVSMGLRWEVNPAPGAADGNLPYTVEGATLSTLTLAPRGTPLWKTSWYNFAPRLGLAYSLRSTPGLETVVRGGAGLFFDTGQQLGSVAYFGPGFSAFNFFGSFVGTSASFPLPAPEAEPPITNPPTPPYTVVYVYPSHLQLPYTLQWNAAVEQSLGKSQALTISYVGSHAARLLEVQQQDISTVNPNFGSLQFLRNGLTSDYNALQGQFQRRLSRGLTALASYTWGHSIDYASQNLSLPYRRASSDYDTRHSFSGAFSYDVPNAFRGRFVGAVLHHWGLDDRFTTRTGFPVSLNGNIVVDSVTGQSSFAGLNLVPGTPLYLYGSQYPGGRAINADAFALPNGNEIGSAPRNFVRGFGAWQMNLAIRRDFPIVEKLTLQFRAEAFNIFNHPNFGFITPDYCSTNPASPDFLPGCTFGQATATLNTSLGTLSPLYQTGGPRSMQFALKLMF